MNHTYLAEIMKTKAAKRLDTQTPPWVSALPEKQRQTVARMIPLLATLTSEADEITAGNLFIRMVDEQFATRKTPTKKAGVALALLRGRVAREELKEKDGGSISAAEAAEKLGISKTAVLKRYHEGKLLGWREARQGAVRFPIWQFSADNVLPGISETLKVLNQAPWMDDWGRLLFFLNQRSSLDQKRPLDLIRTSQNERVLWAASTEVA